MSKLVNGKAISGEGQTGADLLRTSGDRFPPPGERIFPDWCYEKLLYLEANPPDRNPWLEMAEAFWALPEEAWEGIPTDGAINHDHYLYGCPKVDP